jgi:hypothetical protein
MGLLQVCNRKLGNVILSKDFGVKVGARERTDVGRYVPKNALTTAMTTLNPIAHQVAKQGAPKPILESADINRVGK